MDKFLIQRPYITEKSGMATQSGKYTFLVKDAANKSEVKKIVEAEYKVHVVSVNVVNARPKEKRRGRVIGIRHGFKKAIVTLKKGEKLDIIPQ